MPSVSSLIAAHRQVRSRDSLQALGVALARAIAAPPALPVDPVELYDVVEDGGARGGTWQEVRAARDHGDLTAAEYEYLAAAVDALTQEETA